MDIFMLKVEKTLSRALNRNMQFLDVRTSDVGCWPRGSKPF